MLEDAPQRKGRFPGDPDMRARNPVIVVFHMFDYFAAVTSECPTERC